MYRRVVALGTVLLCVACIAKAQSSGGPADDSSQRTNASLMTHPDPVDLKIQQALRERDAIIRNLLERVQELEKRLDAASVSSSRPTVAATRSEPPAAVERHMEAVVNNSTYDQAERHASESLDQALLVRGGLLLPSGMLEVDNVASYYSISSDHLTVNGFALLPVLVVGDITSDRLRRDILIHSMTARLGLPGRLQMDFTVPYGYILNRTVDANNNQTSSSQFGMGDIQAGISKQLTVEKGSMPDLLANIHFKSVTGTNSYDLQSADTSLGTGFNSIQGNITAAKTSDPVVFFGNMSFTRSLPAHHTIPISDPENPDVTSMLGFLRPGDAYGFQLGSVLALNTETSMTVGWDQRFTRQTKLNGEPLPATSLVEGSLRIGTSYMYAPGRMIDVSFGVGLTPDTPNLQFSVGFPFRRSLWRPSF